MAIGRRRGVFYGPRSADWNWKAAACVSLVDSVRRTLFSAEPVGEVLPNAGGWTVERLEWSGRQTSRASVP